jgi:beta-phosphoglucomutase-like phosphatase (HAD superfamily)
MPLEALIFDVDGTLAETEELHRRAFNETFAAYALDWRWSPELYRQLLRVAGGRERIRYYVEAWRPKGGEVALTRLAKIHADKSKLYAEFVATGAVVARPGVRRLATQAHQAGLRLAIATTTSPGNVAPLLRAILGAQSPSWFAAIAAGDAVLRKKPAPDIYGYVLEKLGCPAASCIAFEDSENGVAAAREAGLAVIATPSLYASGDDFSRATSVLSDLGEPDHPCRQLAGRSFDKTYVDLAGLEAWLPGERVRAS